MADFEPLEKVLNMDFSQMRALDTSGGKRATDKAIHDFVSALSEFFSQFDKKPSKEELKTYLGLMDKITQKINETEYNYYLGKYTAMYPDDLDKVKSMALGNLLKSYRDIPTRMQYWAASEEFGGAIRNAQQHALVVKKLNQWGSAEVKMKSSRFFVPDDEDRDRIYRTNLFKT